MPKPNNGLTDAAMLPAEIMSKYVAAVHELDQLELSMKQLREWIDKGGTVDRIGIRVLACCLAAESVMARLLMLEIASRG
jgi:hypothetical protein